MKIRNDFDPLIMDAVEFLLDETNASIGLLQKKFKIQYDHANSIIDQLIDLKIITESTKSNHHMLLVASKKQLLESLTDLDLSLKSQAQEFYDEKDLVLQDFDKINSHEIELIQNVFYKLLKYNQKEIISFDKTLVHDCIKVSNYIDTKKNNIETLYIKVKNTSNEFDFYQALNLLRNQIHTYESLIFHSINMIEALKIKDLVTYYEIYETFDKLNIFNSNWEKEIANKIDSIYENLDELLLSINEMERSLVNEISKLNYYTQASFASLNKSVSKSLNEIGSSINLNNLISGIQTYKLYRN